MAEKRFVLTSYTPLSTKVLINIGDDRANDKTGNLGTSIQSANLGRSRITEILVPGREGLKTGDNAALVYLMSTSTREAIEVRLHPLRIRPTARMLKKLVGVN